MKIESLDDIGDFNACVVILALLPFILLLDGITHIHFWIGLAAGVAIYHFCIA